MTAGHRTVRKGLLRWIEERRREIVDVLAVVLLLAGLLVAPLLPTILHQNVSDGIDAGGLLVAAGAALLSLNK
jgi:hypothetical protein